MKKAKITVVGSFIVDITAFTPHFPVDGESVRGNQIKFGPGGKGSNQATAASRAGAYVIMVTKIGHDNLSGIARDHYKNEGMTTKFLYETDECETGSAIIEVDGESGENRIIVVPGANERLTEAEVMAAEDEIASSDTVLAQLEASAISLITLAKLAKKHGKKFVLNPAPFGPVPEEVLREVDFFTPNETEAEFFSGVKVTDEISARQAAEKLHEMGIKNIIITLGKKGVYYHGTEGELLVPTTDLKAVDTTGAGDAFNGGFCVAISEGKPIKEALEFANSLASISVTRKGTSPAMPTRDEIDALNLRFYGNKA